MFILFFFFKPFIERFEFLEKYKNLDLSRLPKFNAYRNRMKELPAVKQTINAPETYKKMFDIFPGVVDYDSLEL